MNKERGAITLAIFVAMLIFSLYGIVFYGNSVTTYVMAKKMAISVQNIYSGDISNVYEIAEEFVK